MAWRPRLAHDFRPSVVFARSLTRIARGHLGQLVEVLQAIGEHRDDGPFIGEVADTIVNFTTETKLEDAQP